MTVDANKVSNQKVVDKKKESAVKSRRSTQSEGKHKPLQAEMQRLQEEDRKKREIEREKAEAEKQAANARREEELRRQRFASIYEYADDVKRRHPSLPADVFDRLRGCESAGDAKRITKEWLISLAQQT